MAGNYEQLLDIINNPTQHGLPAWDNDAKEIEGLTIKQYLLSIINSLTVGYQFMGVASENTSGGTPDQNVFYIAGAGTYNGFGSNPITIDAGYIGIIRWNGAWSSDTIKIADVVSVTQNSETGHTDINISGNSYPVASVDVVSQNRNAINTIYVGQLEWLTDKFYIGINGELIDDHTLNYVCSLKYPKVIYDELLDVINWALTNWDMTQMSFWKNGVYVGYRIQNGYHLPDGTAVESIDFNTFAINVQSTQIPDYQTRFAMPPISDIQTISDEIDGVSKKTNESTLMLHTFVTGRLVWNDGAYYAGSTGQKITGLIDWYSCSEKYPQAYYYLLADIVDALFITSDLTQISFWKNGVYVGYRIQNGYHRPDGTAVVTLIYDQFAINLDTRAITDYQTRVVFPSFDGGEESHVFGRAFYALGDSTTAGAGSSQSPVKSWANYLTEIASFPSFSKLAISGAFCLYHEGYGRLSAEIDNVPANTTGIVTIMIGTNDFFTDSPLGDAETALAAAYNTLDDTTTFANAFRYCLEKLRRKAPNAVIIVMQPLPSFDAGNVHGHLDETNLFAIRDIERTICNAMGIPIVETQYEFGLSRYTDNWNYFFNDFCHPNDVGYQRIAHCMLGKFIELAQ